MAYQVLARKWRPKTFSELVGQTHVQKALINALEKQQLHHAYLFTGTRGVGKTTIARILSKCLNCEEGVSATPCGVCDSCREISEGRFPDLLEVDAASRTKVEDTRELLENVQYAPVRGRYKVYLIDEVHMLSTHSFNALLKTLEEPPPHVKFLLATTDPQKLPATVLSRCLQFHLRNMSPENIVAHLQKVLAEESISFEEPALWQLANAAEGSMRDAMSLTDQAIAFGGGGIADADVRDMLGTIDTASAWQQLELIHRQDKQPLFDQIESLAQLSTDFTAMLEALLHCLHVLMRHQLLPGATPHDADNAMLDKLAADISAEQLQLYYQMALNGRKDIEFAPTNRIGFEVVVMRMLSFRPLATHQAIQPVEETKPSQEQAPVKKPESSNSEPQAAAMSKTRLLLQEPVTEPVAQDLPERQQQPKPSSENAEQAAAPHYQKASVAALQEQPLAAQWLTLFNQLPLVGVLKSIAGNCELRTIKGSRWFLWLDETAAAVFDQRYQQELQTVLVENISDLPEDFTLMIDINAAADVTPFKHAARLAKQQHAEALQSLEQDPIVQLLVTECGGLLRPDTVTLLPDPIDKTER